MIGHLIDRWIDQLFLADRPGMTTIYYTPMCDTILEVASPYKCYVRMYFFQIYEVT